MTSGMLARWHGLSRTDRMPQAKAADTARPGRPGTPGQTRAAAVAHDLLVRCPSTSTCATLRRADSTIRPSLAARPGDVKLLNLSDRMSGLALMHERRRSWTARVGT